MADLLARTDEKRLLRATAVRVFSEPSQFGRNLIDSGLLALPFSAADDGLHEPDSAEWSDLAIAFAAKGEAYACDTQLFQAVLGGGLIAASALVDRAAIIAGVMAGTERIAVALNEPRARTDIHHCAATAQHDSSGWTLDGTKTLVLGAQDATRLIVVARIGASGSSKREGLGLFLLDPSTPGVTNRHYHLRDGSPASDITLTGVRLPAPALIAAPDQAALMIDHAIALVRLCLAAEASGIMRAALIGTGAYTAERKQFGQTIGAFQVVQHRLADMAVNADQAAAMVAAAAMDTADVAAIDRTHRTVGQMGMASIKAAIQLHGGYGMTEDLPYGRALRRMMTTSLLF
jgi:alkylation response protein AidB-like acyl-CoA dehydrogenase